MYEWQLTNQFTWEVFVASFFNTPYFYTAQKLIYFFICFTTALHLSIGAYRSIYSYMSNICAMAIHLQFLSHVCAAYSTLK